MKILSEIMNDFVDELIESDSNQQHAVVETVVSLLTSIGIDSLTIIHFLKDAKKRYKMASEAIDFFIVKLSNEVKEENPIVNLDSIYYILKTISKSLPIDKDREPYYSVGDSLHGKISFCIQGKFFHVNLNENDFKKPINEFLDSFIFKTYEELTRLDISVE